MTPIAHCILGLVLSLTTSMAVAEEAATTASAVGAGSSTLESGTVLKNRKFEDSHTLTDAKLRADAGSLSHYSAKANLSFYGPPIGDLSNPDQPNLDGVISNTSQRITGSLMGRYRMSPDATISAGLGVALNHPFHGLDRTDANNPFMSYDMSSRFLGMQMRNSPGVTVATVPNYTAIGEIGGANWDNSLVYNLGASRFALSLDSNFSYWIFQREYRPGPAKKGGDGLAQQYTLSTAPGVKYNATDKFNVYSTVGFQLYNPRQDTNLAVLWNRPATLRMGAGYAFTRDIYVSPYLQSYVAKLEAETTSINVSTIFSLL
jgi:hypothetical protein